MRNMHILMGAGAMLLVTMGLYDKPVSSAGGGLGKSKDKFGK